MMVERQSNNSMQTDGRFAAAADAERVCQAWHRSSGVEVPVPGNRGAEGKEKGKGVIVRWGLEEAQSKMRGATNRNRI